MTTPQGSYKLYNFASTVVMLCDWGVKADMVLFAGNTLWSISERVRGAIQIDVYFTLLYFKLYNVNVKNNSDIRYACLYCCGWKYKNNSETYAVD